MKKYETQEFNFNMDWRPKPAVTEAEKEDKEGVKEEGKEEEKTAVENTDNQKRKEANNNNGKRKKFKKGGKNNDSDNEDDSGDDSSDEAGEGGKTIYTAKAINLQPGHTGFLTFATLLPKDVFS